MAARGAAATSRQPRRDEGVRMTVRQRYNITHTCGRRAVKKGLPVAREKNTVGRRSRLWLTRSAEGSRERRPQTAAVLTLRFQRWQNPSRGQSADSETRRSAVSEFIFGIGVKIPTLEHMSKLSVGFFFSFFFDGTRWALKFKLVWVETV